MKNEDQDFDGSGRDHTDPGPEQEDAGAEDSVRPEGYEADHGNAVDGAGDGLADGDFQPEAVERIPADVAQPGTGEPEPETENRTAQPDTGTEAGISDVDPLTRDIEAILFVSPEPVSLEVLAEVTGIGGDELALAVESVRDRFSDPGGGIIFVELAGGYTFRTNDQSLPSVERFCQRPVDYSLSAAAMETLAIVAYLQPITRPEIARIRGIGADTVVANLLEKGLLEESGRSRDSGAVKYRTTRAFEKLFGLAGTEDLPAVEGFEATPQDVEELRRKLYLAADKRQ